MAMRKIRHNIERCLDMTLTEEDPAGDSHPESKQGLHEIAGESAAVAPVDEWRVPRTVTTISFADGHVSRAYVTLRSGSMPESTRRRLNKELDKFLFIEQQQVSSHIWNESTQVKFLSFLAQEVRARRKMLGLDASARALVLMDQASAHMSKRYERIQQQWSKQNNIELMSGRSATPVPSGFGAAAGPNDGWHQWLHALTKSYLRLAVVGTTKTNHLGCAHSQGNLDKMREEMNQPRGAMDDLLHLTDLPDVDGEDVDGTLVHMRVQELAGETKLCWAIQKGDDSSTRVALPTYISQVLEMRVCSFVSEHSAWETRIEGRFAQGKNLSSRQQKAYDQWKLRCEQQLVFSKQHECLVCDSKDVDERCFSIDLLLREDPEKLKVKASDGSEYRLVLLQSAPSIQPHDDLPSELDLELPEGIAEGMELAEEGSAESGEEAAPDEFAALQEADEQYAHDNLEAEPDADLFALADSDEEICLDEDNITQRR
ncbi:Malate dehydrogenase 2 [Durusdinium trenchii]|uniref:Mitochondrial n=1 Tax=Durusdinium trenchii TaxID=1381693 RepID=A0ABP0MP03_9DINO